MYNILIRKEVFSTIAEHSPHAHVHRETQEIYIRAVDGFLNVHPKELIPRNCSINAHISA
jgi:hypothetical protein